MHGSTWNKEEGKEFASHPINRSESELGSGRTGGAYSPGGEGVWRRAAASRSANDREEHDDVLLLGFLAAVLAIAFSLTPRCDSETSCRNRCAEASRNAVASCHCGPTCETEGSCCPDYKELCLAPTSNVNMGLRLCQEVYCGEGEERLDCTVRGRGQQRQQQQRPARAAWNTDTPIRMLARQRGQPGLLTLTMLQGGRGGGGGANRCRACSEEWGKAACIQGSPKHDMRMLMRPRLYGTYLCSGTCVREMTMFWSMKMRSARRKPRPTALSVFMPRAYPSHRVASMRNRHRMGLSRVHSTRESGRYTVAWTASDSAASSPLPLDWAFSRSSLICCRTRVALVVASVGP
ncbi:hypothetical protein CRUP_033525 [Coryphaenoides rupestris]|nr:hypothetical protein CRUP_033525 [Coryphaenoides rupestris]